MSRDEDRKPTRVPAGSPEGSRNALPKYVKAVKRGNRVHLYARHAGKYWPLPSDTTSAAFHEAYAAARREIDARVARTPAPARHAAGSVAAMIAEYKGAPEFRTLAPKTQRDYARALDHLGGAVGPFAARAIRRADIVKLRNKIAARGTRAADLWVSVVARAFSIGLDLGYLDINPAADIPRINDAKPYTPWPAHARVLFEASNPPPHLLRAYLLALYTSLRLGNVLTLARTRYDGTGFSVHHTKSDRLSGEARELYIPAAKPLRDYLANDAGNGLLFVTRPDGRRYSETAFSDEFRAHLDGLGEPFADLHFHGLRKTTAVALVEAGASSKELQAICGWRTLAMAEHYTRGAEQKKLAVAAIRKLDRGNRGK